jgi:transcription-repair coupling factor (superfamily II helicase)
LRIITENLLKNESFKSYIKEIQNEISPIYLLGLTDISKAYIPSTTLKLLKNPICIITYNEIQAKELYKYCKYFSDNTILFSKKEITTYEYEAQSKELLYDRIDAFNKIYKKKAEIVILPIETIMQPIINKEILYQNVLKFDVAKTYNIEKIKQQLVTLGYERCDLIEGRGQFSIRGDIIDIAISETEGVRIELWGDEIDSMRYFNISSQRSIDNIQHVEIYPSTEEIGDTLGNILEYIEKNYIVFIDEENKIKLRAESILNDNKLVIKDLIDKEKKVPYVLENMYNFEQLENWLEQYKKIYLEKQDIIAGKDYIISFKYNELKDIDDILNKEINQENSNVKLKQKKHQSKEFREGQQIIFSDLKVGDYIVHQTNGIGQFIGVNTIKADGVTKDYIKIRYKDDGILYIPTDALDNIRKYIGGGDEIPKLNKLGSKEWMKTKAKVKSNLQEIARNLIELYAKREKAKGYAFSKDTPWQKQFEDDFPFRETDDQLRCISEMKKDMEMQKPMDRLLCGDVGYGKTEVALRGAFKACMDSKQVAYLAPTTILATQQYETFKERMRGYPIKVEVLNRFKSPKQQKEIIKKLKLGEIDIIIGTHRLLSKDVEFKDLGLLIIDEEHRFGVKHKEKIKEYKTNIDVLTMTATPIPRTLHMSIVGVRDMSVIYEPPQDRKPVQTYVLEYDQEVIREAITKELERDGQVYYLYNNIEGIEKKAIEIQNLVPEAKVVYAHGKMAGTEIEEIMQNFIWGAANVIVCTTILESGIDIPNANTIIVENADRLGLAQLYQIRGRVGRSDREAYAYITYKRDKLLSEVADKRLRAIKDFTEFGSGFKIAMRDLEIRGAGSILGEVQHGHMGDVGYEMYCKLLDEVIKEMQGIKVEEEQEVQIDLNITSFIPDEYIQSGSQKIDIYQDIALCRTEEDIEDVVDEITDRYGNMPKEVENLLKISRIKQEARKSNIIKVIQRGEKIIFTFNKNKFNMDNISKLVEKYKNRIKFSEGINPYITYKIENMENLVSETRIFIENCR